MMLRSLLVVSCLVMALPAQRGGEGRQNPVSEKPKPVPAESGDAVADGGDLMTPDGKEANLTPEQRAMMGVRRGAASFCQFHLHTRPAKLMPGQTGTAIVTAVLKGQAVLPSPLPLQVTSAAQQGAVTLGAPNIVPAGLGRQASAYMGQPVYDNYATLELPITVAADAVVGSEHAVVVEMKFDLFDGTSAQSLGTFMDRAVGKIEIGQSPDPAVRGGYTAPALDVTPRGTAAPSSDAGAAGAAGSVQPEAIGGAPVTTPVKAAPEEVPAPETLEPGLTPQVGEDDSRLWLLLGAGGALLAAVLLLALKRR